VCGLSIRFTGSWQSNSQGASTNKIGSSRITIAPRSSRCLSRHLCRHAGSSVSTNPAHEPTSRGISPVPQGPLSLIILRSAADHPASPCAAAFETLDSFLFQVVRIRTCHTSSTLFQPRAWEQEPIHLSSWVGRCRPLVLSTVVGLRTTKLPLITLKASPHQ
jgi:hypothetical protein